MPINSYGRSRRARTSRTTDGSIQKINYSFRGLYVGGKPRPKFAKPRSTNGEVRIVTPADPEKLAALRAARADK